MNYNSFNHTPRSNLNFHCIKVSNINISIDHESLDKKHRQSKAIIVDIED